eukprot:gene14897-biopygen12614
MVTLYKVPDSRGSTTYFRERPVLAHRGGADPPGEAVRHRAPAPEQAAVALPGERLLRREPHRLPRVTREHAGSAGRDVAVMAIR